MKLRVNARSSQAVDKSMITRETINGREHVVIKSRTMPDGVIMNNTHYSKEEIERTYATLEGTPAPVGHPKVDGKEVGALSSQLAVNAHSIGAFNWRVERGDGSGLLVYKAIDVEVAKGSENGRAVLARVEAIERGEEVEPMHTSTGVYAVRTAVKGKPYGYEAKIETFDHDAILLKERGAATPAQGVGLFVNSQEECQVEYVDEADPSPTLLKKIVAFLVNSGVSSPLVNETETKEVKPLDEKEVKELIANSVGPLTEKLEAQGVSLAAATAKVEALTTENQALSAQLKAQTDAATEPDYVLVKEKQGELVANSLRTAGADALAAAAAALKTAAPIRGVMGLHNNSASAGDLSDYSPSARGEK